MKTKHLNLDTYMFADSMRELESQFDDNGEPLHALFTTDTDYDVKLYAISRKPIDNDEAIQTCQHLLGLTKCN